MKLNKVLVVEDDDDSFFLLNKYLKSLPETPTTIIRAETLSKALAIDSEAIQLILTDLGLPDSPDTDTFLQIQQRFPYIPIIVLSGNHELELATTTIQQGAQDYLVKGDYNAGLLWKSIQYAVERKKVINDYTRLFDTSPTPMYILDAETYEFLAVNNAALLQYGYTREEFLQLGVTDIRPIVDQDIFRRINKMVSETNYDTGQWRHKRKNNEIFFVQVYAHTTEFAGRPAIIVMAVNIDEKVNAEKENQELTKTLIEQKNEMDAILSTISEVVWSRRADNFILTYVNKAAEEIYGYTAEELIGSGGALFKRLHPDDKETMMQALQTVLSTGKTSIEYRVYHRDGSLKYLFSEAVLKKDKDGRAESITGVAMDVTKLHEAESKLRAKIEEIQDVLESITDAFYTVNKNWEITYCNSEFERLMHARRADVLGKNLWGTFPELVDLKYFDELHSVLKNHISTYFEEYCPITQTWTSVNAYPTKEGIAVYFLDITEQKKTQQKLLVEEQNLLAIINNTKDIIWSVDTNLNIISANKAFWERLRLLTGKNPEELTPADFDHERLNAWNAYFTRALNGESFKMIITDNLLSKEIFEEVSFNPIHDKGGEIIGVSCYSRDITEQRNYLNRIEKQNEQLRKIALLQSHQVRGPVASIMGLSALFNFNNVSDPANKEILQNISAAADSLDQIIREITENATES